MSLQFEIKSLMKLLLFTILSLVPVVISAQNYNGMLTGDHRDYNLKGKVKSVMFIYTFVNPKVAKNATEYKVSNDVYMTRYLKFNKEGYRIANLADSKRTINDPIDTTNVCITTYSNDRTEKARLKRNDISYPAYNYQKVSLNTKYLYKTGKNDRNPELLYLPYKYLTDSIGRIIKEVSYNALEDFEIYPPDTIEVSQWTEYVYDDKNLLVQQNIFPGKINLLFSGTYYVHYLDVPHSATSYRAFQHDDKGRLVNVSFFINEGKYFEEIYTYHPVKEYITTVERFVALNPEFPAFPASKMKLSYNEYGDVTEVTYFPDGSETWPVHNRFYEYRYDSHNNWIKCTMYLLGTKKEPTLVAEREIEYYND